MKVNEIKKAIEKAFRFNPPAPILISGRAGIGKSQIIKELEKEGYRILDIRLINYDIGDLMLKTPEGQELRNRYASWLKELSETDQKTILLLDEIDKAPATIQRLAYQLILDREVEGLKLSDKVLIVAIQNTEEDGDFSGIEREKPLYDRFVFRIQVEPDLQTWTEYAFQNRIDNRVIAFLQRFPEFFYYENEEKLIATPRRWEFVSKTINDINDLKELEFWLSITVDEEVAVMFRKFIELKERHDIGAIFEGRKEIPNDLDEQYSIVIGLAEVGAKEYMNGNKKAINEFLARAGEQLEAEVQILLLRFLAQEIAKMKNTEYKKVKRELYNELKEFKKIIEKLSKEVM